MRMGIFLMYTTNIINVSYLMLQLRISVLQKLKTRYFGYNTG